MENEQLQLAEQFINHTGRNVFLTGKAGTGKTTFLKHIIKTTHKRTIVAAPTGIAALNAGGVTLHSQFQLPFGGFIPQHRDLVFTQNLKFETKATILRNIRMSDVKRQTIRTAELLIIDEVSMLRADVLDAIDFTLQYVRRSRKPFGGLQILFIGDLLQLPPVVKQEEWEVLQEYYESPFFFSAVALRDDFPVYIELEKIYRQSDKFFTDILNNLRYNRITQEDVEELNRYHKYGFKPAPEEGYITLTTHNRIADQINQNELDKLLSRQFIYEAELQDEYPDNFFPCERNLALKKDAQVMFIKNDPTGEMRFYNGRIGIVEELSENKVVVKLDDGKRVEVAKYVWKNIRYSTDDTTKEIKEDVLGTFAQYPLRLAWAITIHKSQGLTFDKAIIDVRNVFAAGQSYVAMSRLRSLDGLVLTSPFPAAGIDNNESVIRFEKTKHQQGDATTILKLSAWEFLEESVFAAYDFSDLVRAWQQHVSTYNKEESHSEKQKHESWAVTQLQLTAALKDSGDKFLNQLRSLFAEREARLAFIEERLIAAKNYYNNPLKEICANVFLQKRKMTFAKRAKSYANELEDLDDLLLMRLKELHKLATLAGALAKGESLNGEQWEKTFDLSWRTKLMEVAVEAPAAPKRKKEKGTTQLESFRMFQEGKTIEEIATARSLTTTTIEGHLAQMIKLGKLDIRKVMPEDKLQRMLTVMQSEKELTLNNLKAKLGSSFSFGEIKIGLAHAQYEKWIIAV
ncbi:MAG: helix-turn-helix domain-containing protein [Chitinophagales bacterium]|nr:helix-turn-helix domain-containing protein [Chitinophagales bacterium]